MAYIELPIAVLRVFRVVKSVDISALPSVSATVPAATTTSPVLMMRSDTGDLFVLATKYSTIMVIPAATSINAPMIFAPWLILWMAAEWVEKNLSSSRPPGMLVSRFRPNFPR